MDQRVTFGPRGYMVPISLFDPTKLFYVIFDADSEKHIFSSFGDSFEILVVLKPFFL